MWNASRIHPLGMFLILRSRPIYRFAQAHVLKLRLRTAQKWLVTRLMRHSSGGVLLNGCPRLLSGRQESNRPPGLSRFVLRLPPIRVYIIPTLSLPSFEDFQGLLSHLPTYRNDELCSNRRRLTRQTGDIKVTCLALPLEWLHIRLSRLVN